MEPSLNLPPQTDSQLAADVPIAHIAPPNAAETSITDDDSVPPYKGLRIMSRVLIVVAITGYLGCAILLCIAAHEASTSYRGDAIGYLIFAIFIGITAVLLHAVAVCLPPFRDLVRNSFKNR